MSGASRWLAVPAVICACVSPAAAADEQPTLQPYQIVRSLELLQDQLADGDQAALPMQTKLLELIDARLRKADAAAFADKRNVRALLIYGMSGGNPATLAEFLRDPAISDEDRKVLKGVLAYLNGSTQAALTLLSGIDPMTVPAELGSFLALVKGSVIAGSDPKSALKQFDLARLLAPGTLIEEAALRRSLALDASAGQAERFFRASSQYVRRFLRSPYASQFADSFVTGILALHASLDYAAIDEITAMMDADQRKVIYLRIARRAAIEGLTELSAYAAQRAAATEVSDGQDARAQLYKMLSNLTSDNVATIAAGLAKIDRQQLTESDIRLLEAAEVVAGEMTAAPRADIAAAASTDEGKAAPADPAGPPPSPPGTAAAVPAGQAAATPPPPAPAAPVPATPAVAAASMPAAGPAAAGPVAAGDSTDAIVNQTRAKLDAIDKLLKDAK